MLVKTNIVTTQIMPMFQAANNVALGCVMHINTPDKNTQTAAKGYLKKSEIQTHCTVIIMILHIHCVWDHYEVNAIPEYNYSINR